MADDITTLFHEAQTPCMSIDPAAVLAGGRRRRLRRFAAGGSVLIALAAAAVFAVSGLETGNPDALPATGTLAPSTGPTQWTVEMAKTALAEMDLNSTPDPRYFADVQAALGAEGMQTLTILRWSGSGDQLAANGYLAGLGAGVTVLVTHRDGAATPSPDHCALLGGDRSGLLAQPPADRCTTTAVPGGVLTTVDASSTPTAPRDAHKDPLQTAVTQAVFDSGSTVVSITTWVMDTPAAQKVPNPHPVDVGTLTALVQNPSMRW